MITRTSSISAQTQKQQYPALEVEQSGVLVVFSVIGIPCGNKLMFPESSSIIEFPAATVSAAFYCMKAIVVVQ